MHLRLGAIGVGGLGYLQLSIYEEMAGVDVVAAADTSPGAREVFESEFDEPAYADYVDLLSEHTAELDAVTIVTPHTLHYDQAMACFERDLHVLVEKPMVTDVRHAVDLVETADERGLVLEVGYQRHFHPAFQELRRLIDEHRIGTLHTVNCHLGQDWIEPHRDTWRTDPALSGGGQLYDTGSHILDALLWTTGTDPSTVAAQMEFDAPEVDVNSALSLRLDRNGEPVIGSTTISGDGIAMNPTEGYFYWGDGGRISYVQDRLTVAEKGAATYATDIESEYDFRSLTREKLENFAASVEGSEEPAVPGEYGLTVTALTEAAYRAAETGTTVSVPTVVEEARAENE